VKIGFVGAGRMGRPIVDRLRAAGHEVTVLVRRPEARLGTDSDARPAPVCGRRPRITAAGLAGSSLPSYR
jgi:3-hydroxyisobutyrate dehydrogenase-like beta-hydroxyacid dehydrogenase